MNTKSLKLASSALSLLGLSALLVAGCGKSKSALEANVTEAFKSADAPVKAIWDDAASSLKTNGYVPALITLQSLITQPTLTPQQREAAAALISGINDRLIDAASKGDKEAIEILKQTRGSFRR